MDISKYTDDQLAEELEFRKNRKLQDKFENSLKEMGSPVGVWKVTTEGDCEGKTTRVLGTFKGHVSDIAMNLSRGVTGYKLTFQRESLDQIECDDPKDVCVSIQARDRGESESEPKLVKAFLDQVPSKKYAVDVTDCNLYRSVTLTNPHKVYEVKPSLAERCSRV